MALVSVRFRVIDLYFMAAFAPTDGALKLATIPTGATVIEHITQEKLEQAMAGDPNQLVTIVSYDDGEPMEYTLSAGIEFGEE